MKTPWQYAEAGLHSEYAEQVALFMWAAMAAQFGKRAADEPGCYTVAGHADYIREVHKDAIPELRWLHAIKNAGHGDRVRGARNAAEGVRPGVPDIFLPVQCNNFSGGRMGQLRCGLYLEMKRPVSNGKAKGVPSEIQREWHDFLRNQGYAVEICYGWEQARDAILRYLGR